MILLKNRDRNPSFKKGEYVEINDAGNYPMELSVDGVCEQETTTGKNLFKPLNITNNGITTTYDKNGVGTIKGTSTNNWANISTEVLYSYPAGNYVLSIDKPKTFNVNIKGAYTDKKIFEFSISAGSKTKNVKFKKEVYMMYAYINGIEAGATFNETIKIQLEKGSTATDYEPYTGGQPSPSPDYPQEIKTITGSLSVTSCNKNVFKITSPLKHHIASGVDISINDNVITLNGTATGAMWPDFIWGIQGNTDTHNKCKYYFSEQPEDCIASINVLSGTATGGFFAIVANDDSSSNFTFNFSDLQNTKTLKANGVNRAYLSGIDNGTKFDNFTFEIMLEKGSVATAFERHIESQIQANLPEVEFVGKLNDTYKDTLKVVYKEDGHYHLILNKMIGKVVLDGSGTSYVVADSSWGNHAFAYNENNNRKPWGKGLSDYFTFVQGTGTAPVINNGEFCIGQSAIIFKNDAINTLDEFKTWLSTHNTIVYYALAEPYEVDLGIVDTLLSYDEITNIFTDSDLYPVINVKYYKDFEFDKILRSGYNIDEQEYEIAKKQMANGKRKRILSSYDDCIIKINLGLLDNKTYQEYKEQLNDGEFHYWSYKYNQYKKANFILTKPSITTEYAYDDDIGIDDIEITLEKSSDVS